MLCPFCAEQALVVVTTVSGTVDRCPSCHGFFIPWDMLAHFSGDADQFLALLNEAQSVLFPTGRICPHCLGRLSQGRLAGQDGILTLCIPCRRMWTDAADLERLDSRIAWGLQIQLDKPNDPVTLPARVKSPQLPVSLEVTSPDFGAPPVLDPTLQADYAQLQEKCKLLENTLQETFQKREEDLARYNEDIKKQQDTFAKTLQEKLSALQSSLTDAGKKRAEQETHSDTTRILEERLADAKIEHNQQLTTLQSYVVAAERKRLLLENEIKALRGLLEAAEKQQPEQKTGWSVETKAAPAVPETPATPVVAPLSVPPAPQVQPKSEPIAPSPQPQAKPVLLAPPLAAKPSIPVSPPVKAKKSSPLLKPLWLAFLKAWAPRPTAPTPAKPIPPPAVEKPLVKPLPVPVPPVIDTPAKPTPAPSPMPSPVPATSRPVGTAPLKPRERGPVQPIYWMALLATWLPRVLPWIAFLISYSIDEDAGWAFLWTVAVWAGGLILRLLWVYSSKSSGESLIAELPAKTLAAKGRGVPVLLKGSLEDPKAKTLRFQDSSGSVLLNTLSPLEILPRLFGLISGGQFPPGEFFVKGWYRPGAVPFVEVQEVRSDKMTRKSFVRALRWSFAVGTLFFGVLLLLLAS